jgi:hypothetical protein
MQLPKLLGLVLLVENIVASIISGVIDEQHVLSDSRPGIGLVNGMSRLKHTLYMEMYSCRS